MRKNDLIKMLQGIKGNPEVLLWNGMVGDWMHISGVHKSYLARYTKQYWIQSIENEECIKRKDWDYKLPDGDVVELARRYSKTCQWESNNFITKEDIDEGRAQYKTVLYLDAKKRGVSTFDRLGSVEY